MRSPDRLVRTRTFTQADFDRFAELSGDDNPIHVDAALAARTRFGRHVAHGMLLLTVLDGLRGELRPDTRLAGHQLRFAAPTFAGEPMAFEVWAEAHGQLAVAVTRQADGVVTCDGRLQVEPMAAA